MPENNQSENKIQEMQIIEQSLQNILMQKQAFQMEQSETEAALKEIDSSGDEVFKIVGQLMIRTQKDKIKEELENKKKLLDLRLNNFEKQESSLMEKLETIREEVIEGNKNKK